MNHRKKLLTAAVSAGHWPKEPGACYENRCEYGETMPVLAEIIRHLSRQGIHAYLVGTGYLTDKIKDIKAIDPDCCLEIHFNGSSAEATGCETLYYPGSDRGRWLAQSIQDDLPKATQNRDRGIKEGYYYDDGTKEGVLAFLSDTPCPAIIVEPGFIQHEPELLEDQWRLQKIGLSIAKGVKRWAIRVGKL